jgi:hypothetical protein
MPDVRDVVSSQAAAEYRLTTMPFFYYGGALAHHLGEIPGALFLLRRAQSPTCYRVSVVMAWQLLMENFALTTWITSHLGGALHELRVFPSNAAMSVSIPSHADYAAASAQLHGGMRFGTLLRSLCRTGFCTKYSGVALFLVGDRGQGTEHDTYPEFAKDGR